MSEERGKRDDQSGNPSTPDSSTADDAAARTGDAGSAASDAASAPSRPSGKRTTRRVRSEDSADVPATPALATGSPARNTGSVAVREPKRLNIFKRIRQFLREVIAELRKVIWPNKKQMITYTSVVLVFVAFMVAFISGADILFLRGVSWLFG